MDLELLCYLRGVVFGGLLGNKRVYEVGEILLGNWCLIMIYIEFSVCLLFIWDLFIDV